MIQPSFHLPQTPSLRRLAPSTLPPTFSSLPPYLMCNPLPASPTGILCLASGCYVRCLNPTSHVSLLGAAIATQAVGTAMANPRDTAREHDVTYRQGQGHTAGERVMPDQVIGTELANKGRTPSRIGGNEQCTWGVGEGENPISRIELCAKPLRQCRSSGNRIKLSMCYLIAPLQLPQSPRD